MPAVTGCLQAAAAPAAGKRSRARKLIIPPETRSLVESPASNKGFDHFHGIMCKSIVPAN